MYGSCQRSAGMTPRYASAAALTIERIAARSSSRQGRTSLMVPTVDVACPAVKVEMFNVGWLTAAAGIWRRDDDLDQQVRIPIPAYVIETAEERILIDTGLHPAAVDDPARHYNNADALGTFQFEQSASIGEQIDLAAITRVVLTHLHFDHAGGLALLPSSVPIVLQRREWDAGHEAAAVDKNFYLPVDYEAAGQRVTLIDGDHDLLGDGSIRLLSTPGHTPGHQSVRIGERLVIGGDVAHFASAFDDHRFPVFADDFAAQHAS